MDQTKILNDNAVGYIIYPESFKDSNDDGIGDLPGIISKLDYLRDLGVNLLWICPIFKSPMVDNGYDVSDYYEINPRFGTMDDFKRLIQEAHNRGIKIVIDFVLNHTSDQHPWFKKALEDPNSKERNYYIFRKGKMVDGKLVPPNNWASFFTDSVWEQVPNTDEFYFHAFSEKMPDVNWDNPELREEYYKIADFYINLGVDGFRLDAAAHLAKDMSFSDSPLPVGIHGTVLDTSKFSNRPENITYLKDLKECGIKGRPCLLIGEVGGSVQPNEGRLLADRENGVINLLFNFDTVWNNGNFGSIGKRDDEIKTDVIQLKHNFMRWYDACHDTCDMPLYWCNHDHPRVVSQYGSLKYRNESAKMLLTTLLFLYGTPFMLYGDEIGMSNLVKGTLDDFSLDVGTRNDIPLYRALGYTDEQILTTLRRTSRLNGRTTMQWNRGPYAGFSDHKPIMPLNDDYLEGVDIQDEIEDPYSILNFFQYAIQMRKDPQIARDVLYGKLDIIDYNHPDVLAYRHEGSQNLMVISSFRPYTTYFTFYYQIADVLLHNYDGVKIQDHVFELRPFESLLLKLR